MPVKVRRNTIKLGSLLSSLSKKSSEKILVGVNQAEGAQTHSKDDNRSHATLAEIAMYQEYGWVQRTTPKQSAWLEHATGFPIKIGSTLHLPPRPFLRATMQDEKGKWQKIFSKVFEHEHDIHKAMGFVGMTAVEDIKQTIMNNGSRTNKFPERSDLTMAIYSGLAEGHKTDGTGNISSRKALVQDGMLLKSIKYKFADEN